jgi:hypothetical protein
VVKKKEAAPMLNISGANKDAVAEARKAIMDILRTPHIDNSTKVEALKALDRLCGVSNTSITGCSFHNSEQ